MFLQFLSFNNAFGKNRGGKMLEVQDLFSNNVFSISFFQECIGQNPGCEVLSGARKPLRADPAQTSGVNGVGIRPKSRDVPGSFA